MSWQILIFLSIITFSVGIILQRSAVKLPSSDPIAFSIVFQLGVGTLIAIWGLIFENMTFPDFKPLVLNLVLMVILWSSENIFNFSALKATEASTFTIIFSTRAVFTTLASSLFLNEFLNAKQWAGFMLILLGVIIVSAGKKKIKLDKSILLSLMTAISFGFANTNDRVLLMSFNLYPYITTAYILPALGVAAYRPSSVKNMFEFLNKKNFLKTLAVLIVYTFASITFFKALQIAPNSSQVAAINVSGVIVTVLLSIIFLKEHDNLKKKLIAASVSLAGLLLLG